MRIFLSWFFILCMQTYAYNQASNILKKQRLDYEQFEKALFQLEARPYLHISESDLRAELSKLRESLRSPLSPIEQYRCYALVVAKIQCGHTSILPSKKVIQEWASQKQSLPFDLRMVNKKLFVAPSHEKDIPKKNLGEKSVKLKPKEKIEGGTEIVAIDKKTIHEWMQLIAPYISSDENGMDFKYYQAGQLFDFYRYLASPSNKTSVEITYVYKKDTLTRELPLGSPYFYTIQARMNEAELSSKKKSFGTFSIEKNSYGYFRFESFEHAKGKAYNEFLQQAFQSLQKKKIKKLIIDLRGNLGGAVQIEFLKYLLEPSDELVNYTFEKRLKRNQLRKIGVQMWNDKSRIYLRNMRNFKRSKRKGKPYNSALGFEKNAAEKFKGQIAVITDEGTFSAASLLAYHLKYYANAKLVGETPGGTFYAGNAGTVPVKLKKSKLIFQANPHFFHTPLYPNAIDSTLKKPDLIVFSKTFVPELKFSIQPKKEKPTDDPVIKAAEKLLK